ncbi:hypothetical protein [Pseudomonas caspiana]|uniref:hypothetical protein n=1 Tax=Pseudomonas caspiana TaxID=1451454 RepID=UPI0032ED85C0
MSIFRLFLTQYCRAQSFSRVMLGSGLPLQLHQSRAGGHQPTSVRTEYRQGHEACNALAKSGKWSTQMRSLENKEALMAQMAFLIANAHICEFVMTNTS